MLLEELFEIKSPIKENATISWARIGNDLVKKYRCSCGPKKGQLVSNVEDCHEKSQNSKIKLR